MEKSLFSRVLSKVAEKSVDFFLAIKLSIRAKIILVFAIVVVLVVSLNIMFIVRTMEYNRQYDGIIDNITIANNILSNFKPMIDDEMWKIVAGRQTFFEGKQYKIIDQINSQIYQMMRNTDSEKGRLELDVILRTVESLKEYVDMMGVQIAVNRPVADNEVVLEDIRRVSELIEEELKGYMITEIEHSGQEYQDIRRSFVNWVYINILFMGGVVIFAFTAAWIISESTYVPIKKLHDSVTAIVQRDLGLSVTSDRVDEFAELDVSFHILVDQIDSMAEQLRQLIDSLEEQVKERTADLILSMEVGQRATAIRDLDKLLPTVVEFIRDKFNLYYTQVYLVDDINQNLILKAGTGEAGQELLARHYSLPIDANSTVGQAADQAQSIIVSDATIGNIDINRAIPASWYSALLKQAQAQRPDSLLPETLSELAIPLIVEGRVTGVLDLQNDKVRTFTKDNLNVYEAMAVQLAIAIDSARQWALTQEAQKKAEEAIRQLTREAWAERLASSKRRSGFVYDLSRITALLPDAYTLTATPKKNGYSAPLVVQDQTIGYLSVETSGDRDLTEDERLLLQAVAQQLAQKAENLRLFEATQQRASREQIARRIIDRVRASRNIEMALRTATEELSKALGVARAGVDLRVTQTDEADQ